MVWINTSTMNVDQIYEHLARRQLTHSYRSMSRDWFGAAENYACCLGLGGTPSARVQINLFRRLWSERHYLLAIRVATAILWGGQSDG
jgi:hypothetical protein